MAEAEATRPARATAALAALRAAREAAHASTGLAWRAGLGDVARLAKAGEAALKAAIAQASEDAYCLGSKSTRGRRGHGRRKQQEDSEGESDGAEGLELGKPLRLEVKNTFLHGVEDFGASTDGSAASAPARLGAARAAAHTDDFYMGDLLVSTGSQCAQVEVSCKCTQTDGGDRAARKLQAHHSTASTATGGYESDTTVQAGFGDASLGEGDAEDKTHVTEVVERAADKEQEVHEEKQEQLLAAPAELPTQATGPRSLASSTTTTTTTPADHPAEGSEVAATEGSPREELSEEELGAMASAVVDAYAAKPPKATPDGARCSASILRIASRVALPHLSRAMQKNVVALFEKGNFMPSEDRMQSLPMPTICSQLVPVVRAVARILVARGPAAGQQHHGRGRGRGRGGSGLGRGRAGGAS